MKIYTRTGDEGMTSLIGGRRVPKHHERIEAYGTIDELISWLGLIRDQNIRENHKKDLLQIQDRLMICASILAADCDDCGRPIPQIEAGDIAFLEERIDAMEETLPSLSSFILPGGHPVVSYTHITRNVCRRAERNAGRLDAGIKHLDRVMSYLNRLSDYLFVLSRKLSSELGADEIPWSPGL
ncbi:MAG TPA: cob(I)yrinic acid a,c-diamide adenosyltransferase [Bacteroidetes bacterium]|nr:cob(I)yrinic acid a,c-diamide adenosyltransferase [Bacteroidota bacterium]